MAMTRDEAAAAVAAYEAAFGAMERAKAADDAQGYLSAAALANSLAPAVNAALTQFGALGTFGYRDGENEAADDNAFASPTVNKDHISEYDGDNYGYGNPGQKDENDGRNYGYGNENDIGSRGQGMARGSISQALSERGANVFGSGAMKAGLSENNVHNMDGWGGRSLGLTNQNSSQAPAVTASHPANPVSGDWAAAVMSGGQQTRDSNGNLMGVMTPGGYVANPNYDSGAPGDDVDVSTPERESGADTSSQDGRSQAYNELAAAQQALADLSARQAQIEGDIAALNGQPSSATQQQARAEIESELAPGGLYAGEGQQQAREASRGAAFAALGDENQAAPSGGYADAGPSRGAGGFASAGLGGHLSTRDAAATPVSNAMNAENAFGDQDDGFGRNGEVLGGGLSKSSGYSIADNLDLSTGAMSYGGGLNRDNAFDGAPSFSTGWDGPTFDLAAVSDRESDRGAAFSNIGQTAFGDPTGDYSYGANSTEGRETSIGNAFSGIGTESAPLGDPSGGYSFSVDDGTSGREVSMGNAFSGIGTEKSGPSFSTGISFGGGGGYGGGRSGGGRASADDGAQESTRGVQFDMNGNVTWGNGETSQGLFGGPRASLDDATPAYSQTTDNAFTEGPSEHAAMADRISIGHDLAGLDKDRDKDNAFGDFDFGGLDFGGLDMGGGYGDRDVGIW